jgi:hypothetical protein
MSTSVTEHDTLQRALRAVWGAVAWDDRHIRLAAHPLLTGLSRAEIRRWVQAADEVEFDPGQVLLAEDRIGYWFFVVVDGTVVRSRHGRVVDELGAGGHVGDRAVLGSGPQSASVMAKTTVRAFVVGVRHFLPLVYDMPTVQQRLLPDTQGTGFVEQIRALRANATKEWRAIALPPPRTDGPRPAFARPEARPGRPVPSGGPIFAGFSLGQRPSQRTAAPARQPLSWRARIGMAAAIASAGSLAGALYHPPMLVVTPLHPVDISRDIVVTGAPTHPVHGRYLLLPVAFHRPNTFGAGWALLTRRHHLAVHTAHLSPAARREAEREEEAVFQHSQQDAAVAAAKALGLEAHIEVTFRQRPIGGPSGGLIYALAVSDMLSPDDLAGGRTIAATGEIDRGGRVAPIGFLAEKAAAARGAHADAFFVPVDEVVFAPRAWGVRTVTEALRVIRAQPVGKVPRETPPGP